MRLLRLISTGVLRCLSAEVYYWSARIEAGSAPVIAWTNVTLMYSYQIGRYSSRQGVHLGVLIPCGVQAVKDMDKRIHFALNCGAKSCPPIKVYTPDTLEEGLQSAATAFCEGEPLQWAVLDMRSLFLLCPPAASDAGLRVNVLHLVQGGATHTTLPPFCRM